MAESATGADVEAGRLEEGSHVMRWSRPPLRSPRLRSALALVALLLATAVPLGAQAGGWHGGRSGHGQFRGFWGPQVWRGRPFVGPVWRGPGFGQPVWFGPGFARPVWFGRPFVPVFVAPPPVFFVPAPRFFAPAPVFVAPPPAFGWNPGVSVQLGFGFR
jgi:hypothetical protein